MNSVSSSASNSLCADRLISSEYLTSLGEKDQAFGWLDQAYKERSYLLAVYLITDSRLDNLYSDPRFADLQRRIGLPE